MNWMRGFKCFVLLLPLFLDVIEGQSSCPSEHCVCRQIFWRTVMQCINYNGDQVPTFSDNSYSFWDVSFRDESAIKRIQSGAFTNLRTTQLRLQDCGIEQIDQDAFRGVGAYLEGLHFDNNKISELVEGIFSHMPKLMYLSLSNNKIRQLPTTAFADLSHLNYLFLYKNEIEYIYRNTFDHLSQIEELGLHHNKIKIIEAGAFDNAVKLKRLHLLDNYLTFLPRGIFRNNRNITNLLLSDNFLSTLDEDLFSSLENVKVIDLKENRLQTLPQRLFDARNLRSLQSIDLRNNRLTIVRSGTFSGLPNLNTLRMQENMITSFDRNALQNLPQLKKFYAFDNELNSLPDIFNGLNRLEDINLARNKITTISPNALSQLSNLLFLYLDGNRITSLDKENFTGLRKLQRLVLSENRISRIGNNVLQNLPSIDQVDLDHNELTQITRSMFNSETLQNLELSHNKINRIDDNAFSDVKKLQSLGLNDNQISDLRKAMWNSLRGLRDLKLDHNRIRKLPHDVFEPLDVHRLFLQNNEIEEMEDRAFHRLRNLDELRLSGNRLRTIPADVFQFQKLMRILDMRNNRLTYSGIQRNAFRDLGINGKESNKGIQDIQLGENQLERLDLNQFDTRSLETLQNLNISFNPINCNCDMAWMRQFGSFNKTRWITACQSPSRYRDYLAVCYPITGCSNANQIKPFNDTRSGCAQRVRVTMPPRTMTTASPPVSVKTPPSNVNLPPAPSTPTPRKTTTTTSTTSTTTPTTTTTKSTTTSTTTTTPRPTPSRSRNYQSIGFRFNPSDPPQSFRTIYVGSPNSTKIFLPQIQFNQTGRLVSMRAYVAYPVPFETQIWQEQAIATGWSARTCRLIYKDKWVRKSVAGPIQVDFPGPNDSKCINVARGEVLGIMSKGNRMPVGWKWDLAARRDALAYKRKEREPFVMETSNFVGIPLPYRFAIYVEVDTNNPCITSVI